MVNSEMKKIFLLIGIILLVGACSNNEIDSSEYEGIPLDIAIVGEVPKIREEQVRFTNIELSDLRNNVAELETNYDAIFITKEYFEEVSEREYADIYASLAIPTFVIQSMKSVVPFLYADISHEEAHDVDDLMYATGFISKDTGLEKWGYGLYNDIENETNIKDVYSRMFSTIETIRNEK